jgi:hypothetical protein
VMGWIRPRPTQEEIDSWDERGKHYDLSKLPMIVRLPVSALLILIAIPLALLAQIYCEIGYALHRVISGRRKG